MPVINRVEHGGSVIDRCEHRPFEIRVGTESLGKKKKDEQGSFWKKGENGVVSIR